MGGGNSMKMEVDAKIFRESLKEGSRGKIKGTRGDNFMALKSNLCRGKRKCASGEEENQI